MEYRVEEIQPNVWRLQTAGITRVIRHREGDITFAPWEVTSAEGRRLWSAASLQSAFRWIQARTGQPAEALFAQALLERSVVAETSRAEICHEATTQVRKKVPDW